jgi:DNA invertase Pin-like site-specific DNA recombinase
MLVGYARVSANHQNLDRQLAVLRAAGCKRVFKEKESGREGVRRPELERAIQVRSSLESGRLGQPVTMSGMGQ